MSSYAQPTVSKRSSTLFPTGTMAPHAFSTMQQSPKDQNQNLFYAIGATMGAGSSSQGGQKGVGGMASKLLGRK